MKNVAFFSFALAVAASHVTAGTVPFTVLRPIECKVVDHRIKDKTPHHLRIKDGTSENWSGFAAATSLKKPALSSVSQISGTWKVPNVSKSHNDTYCSIWVGIDGYESGTVEQIGTEHDWSNGKEEHYAWFEMYPKYPKELRGFPVEPGDVITAEVSYKGNDMFKLTLSNLTKHVTTTVPTNHTITKNAKRSSAEWIVEAPATSSGVLPLAHVSEVELSGCTATIDGKQGAISDAKWESDKLDMAAKGGQMKAETSSLSNNGKNFKVNWKHQ